MSNHRYVIARVYKDQYKHRYLCTEIDPYTLKPFVGETDDVCCDRLIKGGNTMLILFLETLRKSGELSTSGINYKEWRICLYSKQLYLEGRMKEHEAEKERDGEKCQK